MATIFIDNVPYHVQDGQNLLSACLSLGFNIPYFCWHPAMHAVGACRMCAVKQFRDESDTRGSIVMSCMTPASDGTRVSIDDDDIREFRAAVIEFLMLNHPHDCPVCDEGGECHLQDMTVLSGHVYRRNRFKKRTYINQNLGPFINHEMNRCIQCYRCVRFYRDYAGGRDFNVFGVHDRIYFGRCSDGTLENEFSGNLVEVCPTGVFTDKTLRKQYTRKWDLQTAPSVCPHCGLGCNTIVGERYGSVRRILNRYNHELNGYFLCDRGRFGYEFVNCVRRIRQLLVKDKSGDSEAFLQPIEKQQALHSLSEIFRSGAPVIGLGSPRASLEANFSLRSLVGPENFYIGISDPEFQMISRIIEVLRNGPAHSPSLREVEQSDAVLILGEDVTNTAPRLALSLRQSVRQKPMEMVDRLKVPRWLDGSVRQIVQENKGPLYIFSPVATRLDDVATKTLQLAPDDIARIGFQIAHEIDPEAPPVSDLTANFRGLAANIADTLKQASVPLVVSGTGCGSIHVINAAANVTRALRSKGKRAGLSYTVPECNSLGLGLIGGGNISDCFQRIMSCSVNTFIVLENDLYRRAEVQITDQILNNCKRLIVIDHIMSRTAEKADIMLPSGTFAETTGSFVNSEGRCQRQFRVIPPTGEIQEAHQWIFDIMTSLQWDTLRHFSDIESIGELLAAEFPVFKPLPEVAPRSSFREFGQKIPRQSHRYSGRTSMLANITVNEPKPPDDPESPLSFSMEGYQGIPPASLIQRFWAPGWNSSQSVNKFQSEINGPLIGGDPGQRLIEPSASGKWSYFTDIPEPYKPQDDLWLMIPKFHVFGSEELSSLGPAISERIPKPYVGINPKDAESLGKQEGEKVAVAGENFSISVPVRIIKSLPRGIMALPVGLFTLDGFTFPQWVRIVRD